MSRSKQNEEVYLRRALKLAKKGWGKTHPNPMVGAVIIEEDQIVAEGFHRRAGEPHAEVVALRNLGRHPKPAAVLYVTLEPCSTHGQTPSCVEAILEAGLRRVVVGARDPNHAHDGRGLDKLRSAGVEVVEAESELADECADLNLIFNHHIVTKEPFFALKLAVTADGNVAKRTGSPSTITGPEARTDVMRWRRLFPAIAVGAGTVQADDPCLTARLPDGEWCPRRIILDGRLSSVPETGTLPRVYADEHRGNTIVVTGPATSCTEVHRSRLVEAGVALRELPLDASSHFGLMDLRSILAEETLTGVYFEGGPTVARRLIEGKALDYLFWYESPKRFPNPDALKAPPLSDFPLTVAYRETFGNDVLTRGHLNFNDGGT